MSTMTYARRKGQYACSMTTGTIVFDSIQEQYYRMNETGDFLWDLLSKPQTNTELAQALTDAFDIVSFDQATIVVDSFLETLHRAGLLITL